MQFISKDNPPHFFINKSKIKYFQEYYIKNNLLNLLKDVNQTSYGIRYNSGPQQITELKELFNTFLYNSYKSKFKELYLKKIEFKDRILKLNNQVYAFAYFDYYNNSIIEICLPIKCDTVPRHGGDSTLPDILHTIHHILAHFLYVKPKRIFKNMKSIGNALNNPNIFEKVVKIDVGKNIGWRPCYYEIKKQILYTEYVKHLLKIMEIKNV